MTEIKRLSDEDIEKLKNSTPLKCSECPVVVECGDTIYENNTCEETSSHFIQREMEERERDKMEKNQLPTESELRAELQEACDKFNGTLEGLTAHVVMRTDGICYIVVSGHGDDYIRTTDHKFRPDIEPPAKNTVMIVHYTPSYMDGFFNFPVVSLGEITESGSVKFQFGPCDCRYAMYWYDPQTGNHSAGWDMAWLEGVV